MKPARLFKKLGAAIAVGLIALGIVAGTASTASAAPDEVNHAATSETVAYAPATSGEIT